MVEARQVEYWDEISEEIETAIKQHDPTTAYAMIRRLRGGDEPILKIFPFKTNKVIFYLIHRKDSTVGKNFSMIYLMYHPTLSHQY